MRGWWLASAALCGCAAWAQVTPAEPFGGRPFGAPPAAPPPVAQPAPVTAQPQLQPQPQPVQPAPPAPVAGPSPVLPQPASPMGASRAPMPQTPPAPQTPALPPQASTLQQPVKGLPADAPQLVISGGVYSANPAQRLLIVNGQVWREGANLGSGVVLEQVRPDGAVLGFRGGRYSVFF